MNQQNEGEDGGHCEPDPRNTIEAEIVGTHAQTGMIVRPQSGLATVAELEQQFALAVRQRELLHEYIKKHLIPGKHFYELQGNKPSLTKEGAEIILLPHNLAPDYELVAGPDSPPEGDRPYQITVKCILRRKGDPQSFVGSAIGSAGSHKRDKHGNYNPRQTDRYLCHNATLKMAEKSAMIAATLNSTAGSEFFGQDQDPENAPVTPGQSEGSRPTNPPPKPAPTPPAATPSKPKAATEATKAWFVKSLEPCRQDATRYYIELGVILPTESLEDITLRHVPTTKVELIKLVAEITRFAMDGRIEKKPVPHPDPDPAGTARDAAKLTGNDAQGPEKLVQEPGIKVPRDFTDPPQANGDYDLTQYPFTIIVPVPRKGMKRDSYLKNPDTIGSLFGLRHGDDEESAAARQRLWGFMTHFEPKSWVDNRGQTRLPSKVDIDFRKALDALADMLEKKGEKL